MRNLMLATFALMGVAIPIKAQVLPLVRPAEPPRLPWTAPPNGACTRPGPTYIDCAPGYVPTFDPRTCEDTCVPFDAETPRPLQEERPRTRIRRMTERLADPASEAEKSAASGEVGQAAAVLGGLFEGEARRKSSAIPVLSEGGATSAASLQTAALEAYHRPSALPREIPAPLRGADSATADGVMLADNTDANPLRLDNTIRETGTWSAGGATAGAASGNFPGVILGGVGGAASGAASGFANDLKEKQSKDEESYRRGKEDAARTREDYLQRRQRN